MAEKTARHTGARDPGEPDVEADPRAPRLPRGRADHDSAGRLRELVGGLGETPVMPPDRAARPDAASSVAPIAICYRH